MKMKFSKNTAATKGHMAMKMWGMKAFPADGGAKLVYGAKGVGKSMIKGK